MRALHEAGLDQTDERGVQRLRHFEVATRRRTVLLAVNHLQIRAAAEAKNWIGFIHRFAEQDDGVAFVLEPLRRDVFQLLDEADDGNRGRRINRAGGALIVERAIAAGDGRVKRFATFRQTAHGFFDLPEQLGFERAGHVEIVRRAERQRARAGKIAARFGHGNFRAFVRIEINVTAVAIHGHGDQFFRNGRVANFRREFRAHHRK